MIGIILIVIGIALNYTEPHAPLIIEGKRFSVLIFFYCFCIFHTTGDPSHSFPYDANTVEVFPLYVLMIIALVLPWLWLILFDFLCHPSARRRFRGNAMFRLFVLFLQAHGCVFPAALSTGFTSLCRINLALSNVLKHLAARPRPNFFALCNYKGYRTALENNDLAAYEAQIHAGRFADLSECAAAGTLSNALSSWPSGHTSTAFVCFLLAYAIVDASRPNLLEALLHRFVLCGAAVAVAIDRTRDYWHSHADVLAGAMLGAAVAFSVASMRVEEFGPTDVDRDEVSLNVVDDAVPMDDAEP